MRDLVDSGVRKLKGAAGGDLLVLLSALAVVAGIGIFLIIADAVGDGESSRFDEAILLAFRNAEDLGDPIGGPTFAEMVRDLTALGGVGVIMLVTITAVGSLAMARKSHAAVLVLVATVGGQILSSLLKEFYDRPRPDVVPHLMHASHASFPSGHSLLAAVTYLTIGALTARMVRRTEFKAFILLVALIVTALVGISRVYLGVHYPTDVLGGWTVGLIWAILCWEVARWLQRGGMVEHSD